MTIWVDAQLSPVIAKWMAAEFDISAAAVRDFGLRDSTDREIFLAARAAEAIVLTKDSDFLRLQLALGLSAASDLVDMWERID